MIKKVFLVFIFGFITGLFCQLKKYRVEFEKWPQMKFKNVRILVGKGPLSNQGFAGAELKDMENTIIIFPDISEGTIFTNEDQGYGSVKTDLKIYYLDKNFNIIKCEIMKKEKGISQAPKNTFIAVEGLP
ncbi:MAG: hypothetical protein NC926_01925 [Candidatus Omnitrophica bacterium]|nr:hypothetical protein [Candidatus Omnitrophota bacterium]MCM8806705.1 hypothetical protein [Candidatus Omnitrophota bacterium]